MTIHGAGSGDIGPLVVKPRDARRMLSCGQKKLYELLRDGQLESFKDGGSRKITVSSIEQFIARGLTAPGGSKLKRPAGKQEPHKKARPAVGRPGHVERNKP